MGTTRVLAAAIAIAVLGAGCGDSKSDSVTAMCDAVDGVATAVQNLRSFDPAVGSADDLKVDEAALDEAVADLSAASDELNAEVAASVESAWDGLKDDLSSLSSEPITEAAPEALATMGTAVGTFQLAWNQAIRDANC
jgi:hypothetical protein